MGWPRRVTAAVCLVLVGGAACGGDGEKTRVVSETPRVTAATAAAPEDAKVLLTPDELHGIGGFQGVRAGEIKDVPIFENPDPRGPCGGSVPAIGFDGAFGRSFQSDRVQVIELVTPSTPRQKDQLAAYRGDVRADCRPYDSRTNTGLTQHVSDISVLALDDLGVPAVGWASTIEVEGQRVQGGVVLAEVGERFVFLQFQARTLPPAPDLQELARRAVARARTA